MIRTLPILLLLAASGCIARPDSPAGPVFGQDSEQQLSARANAIWRDIGRRPMIVSAARGIGSPAAVWVDDHLTVYVPAGANGKIADALMALELSKASYALGDGSFVSNLTMPARMAGAALHTPPSELLSWYQTAAEVAKPKYVHYTQDGIVGGGDTRMRR